MLFFQASISPVVVADEVSVIIASSVASFVVFVPVIFDDGCTNLLENPYSAIFEAVIFAVFVAVIVAVSGTVHITPLVAGAFVGSYAC